MRQLVIVLAIFSMTTMACSQSSKTKNSADKMSYIVGDADRGTQEITKYIKDKGYERYSVATFAGGCFWCTEAALDRIEGVVDVISGYAGGVTKHPTYEQTGTGRTGHTESIQLYFDSEVVSYEVLLAVLFVSHNPTQANGQGNDIGPEYRSAIFYHNDEQKAAIYKAIKTLNETGGMGKPIATEVAPYKEFWVAEEYHQNYYELHPENSYVRNVSKPKVEKVKKVFKDILKENYGRK
ncbi:MAG: peptide-methionine (S)-S-oxide reductase [Paraglaciecola sp.]|jgi:peptide-methionine (S)-S-oxide reductase